MRVNEIIGKIDSICNTDIDDFEIKRITSNTNEADTETLFVALKRADGGVPPYDKINSMSIGAVICEEDDAQFIAHKKITVKSARSALAHLTSLYYGVDYSKTKFIAITGTNGKTTTATILYKILLSIGSTVGFIGTGRIEYMGEILSDKTYSMTTPDPHMLYKSIADMQARGCKYIVMEVSSHSIALEKIAPITFDIGIFTNLSTEHLDFHKDMESYYLAKLKLFDQVKLGIFNNDDDYSRRAHKESNINCTKKSVGIIWPADISARDIILDGFEGSSYFYKDCDRIFRIRSHLVGYYNVYNSLMATAAGISLGIPAYLIKDAVANIKHIDGRFEIIRTDVIAIIDYAHTPYAFKNVLKSINSIKKSWQKVTTVFGCGGERDRSKRSEMGSIASKYSSHVIITEDNSRHEPTADIIADIIEGIDTPDGCTVIPDREDAIGHAICNAAVDDIVMILGKGCEGYLISNSGISDYSEREVVLSALEKRMQIRK